MTEIDHEHVGCEELRGGILETHKYAHINMHRADMTT